MNTNDKQLGGNADFCTIYYKQYSEWMPRFNTKTYSFISITDLKVSCKTFCLHLCFASPINKNETFLRVFGGGEYVQ